MSCPRNGPSSASSGSAPSSISRVAGRPVFGRLDQRVEVAEERARGRAPARARRAASAAGRAPPAAGPGSSGSRVASRTLQRARASPSTRRGTSGRSGSSRPARRCATPSRRTRAWTSVIRFAAAPRLGERAEHHAGVLDEPLHRALLRVEHLEQVGAVGGEAGQLAERVVEVPPAALDALARSCCQVRNASRVAGIQRSKISSSSTVSLDLRVGQPAALGDRLLARARASARRRSRRAASSGAGSRARRRAAARTGGRSRSSRRCGCGRRRPRPCAPCRSARRPRARRPPGRASSPPGTRPGRGSPSASAAPGRRTTATGTAAARSTTARRRPSRGSAGVRGRLLHQPVAQASESVRIGVSIVRNSSSGCLLDDLLERRARRADRDRAEQAVGVGGREQLRRHVLRPGEPEQVALLAGRVARVLAAVRVVGEQVEEVVERA